MPSGLSKAAPATSNNRFCLPVTRHKSSSSSRPRDARHAPRYGGLFRSADRVGHQSVSGRANARKLQARRSWPLPDGGEVRMGPRSRHAAGNAQVHGAARRRTSRGVTLSREPVQAAPAHPEHPPDQACPDRHATGAATRVLAAQMDQRPSSASNPWSRELVTLSLIQALPRLRSFSLGLSVRCLVSMRSPIRREVCFNMSERWRSFSNFTGASATMFLQLRTYAKTMRILGRLVPGNIGLRKFRTRRCQTLLSPAISEL